MANQYLREMAPDGQVLADMRSTSRAMYRSNWFRSFLTGAAIATLISLIAICFFEWYLFTVVQGLAVTLSPIVETLRRIEDYPQRRPSFRDLEERRPPEQFAASLEEHHDRTGIKFLCVSGGRGRKPETDDRFIKLKGLPVNKPIAARAPGRS